MSLTGGAVCRGCVNTGRNVFSDEYCGCPYGQQLKRQERMAGMLAAMASALEGLPAGAPITPALVAEAQRRAQEWLAQHPAEGATKEGEGSEGQ